jgi:16S rRNA U516 pseudouridylate synthase RsuA-like enzyme
MKYLNVLCNFTVLRLGRVGMGRVGLGRMGLGRVGLGRVGSWIG